MSESSTMGKRIRQLRESRGFTQSQMAEKLGINSASFSSYERDNSIPPGDKLAKIADILASTMDYIAGRIDNPMALDLFYKNESTTTTIIGKEAISNKLRALVPLIGSICAGEGLIASENIEDYVQYPLPNKRQPDYALRVKGESMKDAGIEDGDIVFLRNAQWAEFNGQIVAAIINGEHGMLKKIKWESGSPVIKLEPSNSDFKVIEAMPNEIVVCGVYEGHFKPSKELN